jgi:hypothetical protein
MHKIYLLFALCLSCSTYSYSQKKLDSVAIAGYLDLYYAKDFRNPSVNSNPLFVSSNQYNKLSVNFAYLSIGLFKKDYYLQFTPAFGTYMDANYANESKGTRWIFESYVGKNMHGKKFKQLDIGIFSSPYTQETAISSQQLMYSRSLSAEYTPYYLSGLRANFKVNDRLSWSAYLVNGYQHLPSKKYLPAFGSLLHWTPNKLTINWSLYLGNEQTKLDKSKTWRLFNEVNLERKWGKLNYQSCGYLGFQVLNNKLKQWWQINSIVAYQILPSFSVNARLEYFSDVSEIMINQFYDNHGIYLIGSSMGIKYKLNQVVSIGSEAKLLHNKTGLNSVIGSLFLQAKF